MPENENENGNTSGGNNTVATVELKRTEFSRGEDVPASDGLLLGLNPVSKIKIIGPADLVRGELLMSNSDGNFISATKTGISSANEICILCEDVLISDSEYMNAAGYFSGQFAKNNVIFSWEDENSNHAEEVEDVRSILRRHKIFLQ